MSEPREEPTSPVRHDAEEGLQQSTGDETRHGGPGAVSVSHQEYSAIDGTEQGFPSVDDAARPTPLTTATGQTPLFQAEADSGGIRSKAETKMGPRNHQARTDKERNPTPDEDAKPTLSGCGIVVEYVPLEPGTYNHYASDEISEGATEYESHIRDQFVKSERKAIALAGSSTVSSPPYMPYQEADEEKEQSTAVASVLPNDRPLPIMSTPLAEGPHTSHSSMTTPTAATFPASPLLAPGLGICTSPSLLVPTDSPPMSPTPSKAPIARGCGLANGEAVIPVHGALAEVASPPVPSKMDMSTEYVSHASVMQSPDSRQSQPGKLLSSSDTAWSKRKIVRFGSTTIREFTQGSISAISSHPIQCSLAFGLMLLSATLVALLAALLTRRNVRKDVEDCAHAECVRARESLLSLMDDTVEPCEDFHTHVCRRWEALVGLSYAEGVKQQLAMRVSNSLLNANRVRLLPRNARLVAALHRLCYSFMLEPGREALRAEMLRSLDGFFGDLLTLDRYSDVIARLVNLSLAQGVHTVLGAKLLRRGVVGNVRLFPGKSLREKLRLSSTAPFDQYMRELVAAKESVGRSLDVNIVIHIEEQVHRILAVGTGGDSGQQELKVSKLVPLNDALDANSWLAALNAHLPDGQKLSDESDILVDRLASLKSILQLFASLPKYGVAYLYFNALLDGFQFDYLRTLPDKNDADIVLTCLQASAEAMWHTNDVLAEVVFGNRSSEAGSGVTRDVLHWVRLSLSHGEGSLRWMGGVRQRHVNQTLSTLSLYLHDQSYLNVTYLDINHAADDLLTMNRPVEFLVMYLRLRAEQQQAFLNNPATKPETEMHHFFREAPMYDGTLNALVVPGNLRVEPLIYSQEVPFQFSAGTLGVLMAMELHRAILLSKTFSLWSAREEGALARFHACIRSLALTIFNTSVTTAGGAESGLPREEDVHLAWMMAARTAHEGLRLALKQFRKSPNWSRYWKRAQKTFFRRFCLLTCARKRHGLVRSQTVTPKFLCLLSVANMPEFAEAFDCPVTVDSDSLCALE